MLWQNHNTIVVGKHQNTLLEINPAFVEEHHIRVARRLSGGGAVDHDLGNLNFTFIASQPAGKIDFSPFCRPVIAALAALGVQSQVSGRNDMTIEGKKFSGCSQYVKGGRVMHHGTILYDSDLSVLARALRAPADKFTSKGLPSVRSRVTNVRPYVAEDLSVGSFLLRLRQSLFSMYPMRPLLLTDGQRAEAARLRETVYRRWEWNFGASPPCQVVKTRRMEGCGQIQVHMDLNRGCIQTLRFYGDFFSLAEPEELARMLLGCPLEAAALQARISGVDLSRYFRGMQPEPFLRLLLR